MSKITGRVEIFINSIPLLNKPGARARGIGQSGALNVELEPVFGQSGLTGFIEKPVIAELEVTVSDRDDVDLSALSLIRQNGTVIFRSAGGGKVYTMKNATCVKNFELTSGKGETVLKFIGASWTEGVFQEKSPATLSTPSRL